MKKQQADQKPKLVKQAKQKLKECAQQLNELQTDITTNQALSVKHGKITLNLCLKAGAILGDAKHLVPTSKWGKWLKDNVKGITVRTAQNYMRLVRCFAFDTARAAAVKGTPDGNTKHVSLLASAEGLREAYILAGIIKKSSKKKDKKQSTPEQVQRGDEAKYKMLVDQACAKISADVCQRVEGVKSIDWDLSKWTVQDEQFFCNGEPNHFHSEMYGLADLISRREFDEITEEDEIRWKSELVVNALLKTIISKTFPVHSVANGSVEIVSVTAEPQQPVALESNLLNYASEAVSSKPIDPLEDIAA